MIRCMCIPKTSSMSLFPLKRELPFPYSKCFDFWIMGILLTNDEMVGDYTSVHLSDYEDVVSPLLTQLHFTL